MSYILLVDDEPDILDILCMSLQLFTTHPFKTAFSGNQALQLIEKEGEPLLIISDFQMPDGDGFFLYTAILQKKPHVPFVIYSGNPVDQLKETFPAAYDIINKPQFLDPLKRVLQRAFLTETAQEVYIKVPLGYLLSLEVDFDGFISLGEGKFVKVHSKGDVFDQNDVERFQKKSLNHLFVPSKYAVSIVEKFQEFMAKKMQSQHSDNLSLTDNYEILDTVTSFIKVLGMDERGMAMAKSVVSLTIKTVAQNKDWAKILERSNGSSFYSHHVTLLSMLLTVVANRMGWGSEGTAEKLIFAALLHDYFVEENDYEVLRKGDAEATKLEAEQHYRQHPVKVTEFAQKLKNLPSDVDRIILQHHEYPDGSGFPRSLQSAQISPMSAVFIICEALVHFIEGKKLTPEVMNEFWNTHPLFLTKEPFRKIAQTLKT